ncbi:MAG: sigma-70 family RNA polymerase sigma factor [Fuerstiella sp.]
MTNDWGAFVEEFGPLVYASAWRILKQRQEAEDVTQDVFTFAWTHRSEHVNNMAGWLRHIAVRRALDRLRRRRAIASSDLELIATADDTSCAMEFSELEHAVRTAVASLPEQQSTIFSLRYFEQMQNRDIAEHLAISPSAVSSALHAARTTLVILLTPIIQGSLK